MNVLADSALD